MIKTEVISAGVIKVVAPKKLKASDFVELAPKVEAIVKTGVNLRLLVDASQLDGWENVAALETHASFVKDHQQAVERIAVIVRHEWQHWLVGAAKVFLHPQIRMFDENETSDALAWITNRGQDDAATAAAGR